MRKNHYIIETDCANEPFVRFDSFADFADWREKMPHKYPCSDDWAGGTFEGAMAAVRGGDLAAVPAAEKYADMLNDAVDIAGSVDSWRLDVSGAFPCVPEFLAGNPECMYQMTPERSPLGPLNVAFDITCSWKVSEKTMRRRGVCLLAALLALSRVRPVVPWVYSSCYVNHCLVRLSSPLDVSEICAAVTRPDVSRQLFIGAAWCAWKRRRHPKCLVGIPFCRWKYEIDNTKNALVRLGGLPDDSLVLTQRMDDWSSMDDAEFVEELNAMIDRARAGA